MKNLLQPIFAKAKAEDERRVTEGDVDIVVEGYAAHPLGRKTAAKKGRESDDEGSSEDVEPATKKVNF